MWLRVYKDYLDLSHAYNTPCIQTFLRIWHYSGSRSTPKPSTITPQGPGAYEFGYRALGRELSQGPLTGGASQFLWTIKVLPRRTRDSVGFYPTSWGISHPFAEGPNGKSEPKCYTLNPKAQTPNPKPIYSESLVDAFKRASLSEPWSKDGHGGLGFRIAG